MGDILIYVKTGCPYCEKLMNELREKGISFKTKNVSEDKEALSEAKEKYEANKVPVMIEGNSVTFGYGGKG